MKNAEEDISQNGKRDRYTCIYNIICWKFSSSPLKNDGWRRLVFFWDGNSSGAILNSGVV